MYHTYIVVTLFVLSLCSYVACEKGLIRIQEKNEEGKIVREYSIDKDSMKQGPFVSYYGDGKTLYEQSNYVNGLLCGKRLLYFKNGHTEIIENYKDGVLNDSLLVFYDNGKIQLIQIYTNGVLEGPVYKYYSNGSLQEEVWFSQNVENGPFKEYYPNGNLKWTGHYKNGDNEQGEILHYDESGQLLKKLFCDSLSICRTTWQKP